MASSEDEVENDEITRTRADNAKETTGADSDTVTEDGLYTTASPTCPSAPLGSKVRVHRLLDGGTYKNFKYVEPHMDLDILPGDSMRDIGDQIAQVVSGAETAEEAEEFLKEHVLFSPMGNQDDLFAFAKESKAEEIIFDADLLGTEFFLESVKGREDMLPSLLFPRMPRKQKLREQIEHAMSCERPDGVQLLAPLARSFLPQF